MSLAQSFGKVAVLLGGTSAEREVSLASGNTVFEALKQIGLDVIAFDPKEQPLTELQRLKVDRVFNVLHGSPGEDGTVQGALEFMNIPYTGSSVLGSALAMDKVRCKQLFKAVGLPTAEFEVISSVNYRPGGEERLLERLGGTVFVKPANEGSSIGMNRADNVEQLRSAIETALQYDHDVLVEAFIDGPEYTVAILNDRALPVIELRTPRTFYDYKAKYQTDTTEYICPCDLNEQLTEQIQAIALAAFKTVAASGWGRVDVMIGADGQFKILEVNTVPGMTAKSLVPMAAKAAGIELNELLLQVLATSHEAKQ